MKNCLILNRTKNGKPTQQHTLIFRIRIVILFTNTPTKDVKIPSSGGGKNSKIFDGVVLQFLKYRVIMKLQHSLFLFDKLKNRSNNKSSKITRRVCPMIGSLMSLAKGCPIGTRVNVSLTVGTSDRKKLNDNRKFSKYRAFLLSFYWQKKIGHSDQNNDK